MLTNWLLYLQSMANTPKQRATSGLSIWPRPPKQVSVNLNICSGCPVDNLKLQAKTIQNYRLNRTSKYHHGLLILQLCPIIHTNCACILWKQFLWITKSMFCRKKSYPKSDTINKHLVMNLLQFIHFRSKHVFWGYKWKRIYPNYQSLELISCESRHWAGY